MKLIIDISKEYYEVIKEIPNDTSTADMLIIKYGKPFNKELQEIRQEITNLVKTYPFIDHKDTYVKEDEVLEVIDKHIKQIEGSDKE